MTIDTGRPTPIRHAARTWSLLSGGIGAVATFLVTNQALDAVQADSLNRTSAAVDLLISAVLGVITAGSGAVAAFGTAKGSEDKVTPLASPRDGLGNPLVPTVNVPPRVYDRDGE